MLLLEQKVIDPFVSNVERIVLEAELTPDQIKQLFTSIETDATAAGGNRTAVGKGADAVKNAAGAIKAEIDKLGAAIKSAGPVQNMDAKFKELKTKIGEKDSKVVSAVKAVSDWAKENPGKASVAVAILTSAAALAGGPLGGLVGGFLGRATKDILQGKDLSTAIGKSAMTGAVGAGIGGAIELIGDLVDPDVAQTLIASDGQSIDVGALEGMKATSIENLAPEAAEDLLKTQNALETALKNVSGEELEVFQAEFEEVSAKINELGGRDALADHAGLEGSDLARDTTTTTDVGVDKTELPGDDGDYGDQDAGTPDGGATDVSTVETVPAEPVSADQLKKAGINFDTEPNISPEVAEWAQSKGIDPEQLQKMFQMEKGMADAQFMGQNISANTSSASAWTGDAPELGSTTLPDGAEIKVGDQFKSTVSTSVGGIEPPISFTSSVTVEGVDANGDPVFAVKEVTTQPTHPVWDAIDKANLSDEDTEKLFQFMNEYTGVSADSKAGIDVVVDTFKQDLAKSIGAAATAVAMSVAMQDKKVVGAGDAPAKAQESIDYKVKRLSEGQIYMLFNKVETVNTHMLENKLMFESVFDAVSHYHRQNLNEGPMDALKGAASKVGGALKTGAKAVGGAISGAAKQVTTKVTAEKLNTAWKKAGSPTDSAAVYDVIKGLGVADDVIKGTFDSMKIEVPAATDAPDGDQDPGAADADTNADAPTDSTAGDGGSDTSTTGAADTNAGGDEPAPTDDTTNTASTSDADDETALGKAKEQRAIRLGRGLSPQEEKQVEKEFTAAKELKKQGIEKGTEVTFKTAKGQQMKGTIVGPSEDGRETHLSIKDEKNKTYNFPKAGLMDKTGKPIAEPKAGSPDASPEDNLDKTGNPVGAPTDGATDTNTASTSGGQDDNAIVDPQTGKSVAPDATSGETPAPDNRGSGQGQDTAAPGGATAAPVDINKLAAELKKLGPDAVEDAKKLLAA